MNKVQMKDSGLISILEERYGEDSIVLIATSSNHVPTVRSVDSFFYDGSFWIVTDSRANYVQEIEGNEYAMISDGGHNRFWCRAKNIGHPLKVENLAIRDVYKKMFSNWYEQVNNEDLATTCFIQVTPYKGYVHKDKVGYQFNIEKDEVIIKDITHHIDVKLQPFW